MSIKDLFNKKTVVFKNAESASIDAESIDQMLNKAIEQETFIPAIDFATASNFVKFGSAQEYYLRSIERIYKNYPYDGSQSEKLQFTLSSSYLDRWIYSDKYPKTTGYATLNPSGYGTAAKSNGYGLNTSADDYEYIKIGGGVHVRDWKQEDPDFNTQNVKMHKRFPVGNKYDDSKKREGVFQFTAADGFTFEWWMKKTAFDTSFTDKEVILDLWNGEADTSLTYGRITLELDATNEGGAGANPFRLTYQNGRRGAGVFRQSLVSGSFTTADVADGNWHHWGLSARQTIVGTQHRLELKLYKDGIVINEQSIATISSYMGINERIGDITGRLDGYMGALIAPVWNGDFHSPATTGVKYAGKLSASLDEVRFWKKRIDSRQIYNNWFHPIGGGSNTDDYRKYLGLYYKFNEGITGTSTVDSVVMDYSGRTANGVWTGYSANSRNTGSCYVSSSVTNTIEPEDPIIRSMHPRVTALLSEMSTSGSQFDVKNPSYMFDMVPAWMRDRDELVGDENLKKFYHILATYFDTLHAQITALPNLKSKQYFEMTNKPYPFVKELLEGTGLIVPSILVGETILEKFSDRDDQNKKFDRDLEDLKKRIYYNIYNNIKTIFESKGTEKSYRNLLRCFGVDDEIIKLNLYTDGAISYLTDKAKYTSFKTKFLNHNTTANYSGRVFNTVSANNTRSYISGSGTNVVGESSFTRLGPAREKNLAFTLETDIIVPKKKKIDEDGYIPTDFLSASIMGFHEANPDDSNDYSWHGTDWANLQVYLCRRHTESDDAKFVIRNKQGNVKAETQYYKNIYGNERWALALKVYPVGYPFVGTVATGSNPNYVAELYGVNQILNEPKEEFKITATIDHTTGSAILCNAKRFYAGCEATNFTGLALNRNDTKIAACRLWYDKLEDSVLKQHNKDASNYGHSKIYGNPTPYVKGLENKHIPSQDVLAFNWDFQLVTTSDSSGEFTVADFSSGSATNKYGWFSDLIMRENQGKGMGYATNSTSVVINEFIFSQKKELPEISFTSDGVFIKGEEEELFGEDEDINDNIFAFEKSMYQVLSEEIFNTFTTVTEYTNLFLKPVDRYREEYNRLKFFKENYFARVSGDLDFERFTNYYKFLDSTISAFIQQLHPAMSKFNEGISDMVESHILERPKYQRQFPFITTRDTVPDGKIVGVKERLYNWRSGHAPDYLDSYDDNDHCLWQKDRRERTAADFGAGESNATDLRKLNELKTVIVSEVDGTSKSLGTSRVATNPSNRPSIYEGGTYAVRSFGRQYHLSYEEQKTIHSGINYGHQKIRDYIIDHTRPHGNLGANNSVPQNVMVVGVGQGKGLLGLDKCKHYSDPFDTVEYSKAHLDKAEYRFDGIVGKYADSDGQMPKSDVIDMDHRIKGHRGFPFNMVSGTLATGYNAAVSANYDPGVILTNLHSDTTTLSNEIPLQSPFTETWVGGRQFRHIPMNRAHPTSRPSTTIQINDISNDQKIMVSDQMTTKTFTFKDSADVSNHLEVQIGQSGTAGEKRETTAINLVAKITHADNNLQVSVVRTGGENPVLVITNARRTIDIEPKIIPVTLFANSFANVTVLDHTLGGPGLDTPFTRPEAYRLLLGDHAGELEANKDGAFGIVGPDYGGPYPDTTRKWAVHYRGDRIKRPINIANISYSTSSALLGNYQNKYEVVHTVGRLANNLKFREFADVSSSLPADYGTWLPATTHPMSLVGIAPFVSGNVFGVPPVPLVVHNAGQKALPGQSNLFIDRSRILRPEYIGQKSSGSFTIGGSAGTGSYATGVFVISGASCGNYSSGSFKVSASYTPGAYSTGHFEVNVPNGFTVSTGSLLITGSTKFGSVSKGSFTLNSLPDYTVSTGLFKLTGSTKFGSVTSPGNITIGALPSFTTSEGHVVVKKAHKPAIFSSGSFEATGSTKFATQYTGSLQVKKPRIPPHRPYQAFTVKKVENLTDGDRIRLKNPDTAGSYDFIEIDDDGSHELSSDVVVTKTTTPTVRAIKGASSSLSLTEYVTPIVGSGDFTLSFWYKNGDGMNASGFLFYKLGAGGFRHAVQLAYTGDGTVRVRTDVDDGSVHSTKTYADLCPAGEWNHMVIVFDCTPIGGGLAWTAPSVYKNGSLQSGTGWSSAGLNGNAAPTIQLLQIKLDDNSMMHDLYIFDGKLNSSEVSELYANGSYVTNTDLSVSLQSKIDNYWPLGEEADFTTWMNDAGGSIPWTMPASPNNRTLSDTVGSNTFAIANENELTLDYHTFPTETKDSETIWDGLKTSLQALYTNYDVGYISGSQEAQFFITKKVNDNEYNDTTVMGTNPGSSFALMTSSYGRDEYANSSVDHGDDITLAGETFTVVDEVTSGSNPAYPLGVSTYGKALEFDSDQGSGGAVRLYNTSYVTGSYPRATGEISVSFWARGPAPDNAGNSLFQARNAGGDELYVAFSQDGSDTKLRVRQITTEHYSTALSMGSNPTAWNHYTLTIDKSGTNKPKVWINGAEETMDGTAGGAAMDDWTQVYVGGHSSGQLLNGEQNSIRDLAIWNTGFDIRDAKFLYNSGSVLDLRSFSSASYLSDWWQLGPEGPFNSIASGSNINAVASIASTVGHQGLTVEGGTHIKVTDGPAELRTPESWFDHLQAEFNSEWSAKPGTSGISYSFNSTQTSALFTLVSGSDVYHGNPAPPSFTKNGAWIMPSNPSANGDELGTIVAGAVGTDYVQIASTRFYPDPANINAGGNYALDGGDYYVLSSGTSTQYWGRLMDAINYAFGGAIAAVKTEPDSNAAIFHLTASVMLSPNITKSGTSFTLRANALGNNNIDGKRPSVGAQDGDGFRITTDGVDRDVLGEFDVKNAAGTYIADGVKKDGSVYYTSITGSTNGSAGVDADFWNRIRLSLLDILPDTAHMGGAPSVVVYDVGNETAEIGITGSFTGSHLQDSTFAGQGSPTMYAGSVAVAGYGHPPNNYKTNRTFTIKDYKPNGEAPVTKAFTFHYPYEAASADANVILVTGSLAPLLAKINLSMSTDLTNWTGFQIDGNTISFTGSVTGSHLNSQPEGTCDMLTATTTTVGGSNELGVGEQGAIKIRDADLNSKILIYTSKDLKNLGGGSTYIAEGVKKSGIEYYVSSTGSDVGDDGDNTDFWGRIKTALDDSTSMTAYGADASYPYGRWYLSGSDGESDPTDSDEEAVFYYTGSLTASAAQNWEALPFTPVGHRGNNLWADSAPEQFCTGYGNPPDAWKTNKTFTVKDYKPNGEPSAIKTFTFSYPYQGYQASTILITGSHAAVLSKLNLSMSAELTNWSGLQIDGSVLSLTASVTGSHLDNAITDNAEAITVTTPTAGGSNQLGVGHHQFLVIMSGSDHYDPGQVYGKIHSSTNVKADSGDYIYEGVKKDSSQWNTNTGWLYYVSSTGSVHGSDGTNVAWWNRVKATFEDIMKVSGNSDNTMRSGEHSDGRAAKVYVSGSAWSPGAGAVAPEDTDMYAQFFITGSYSSGSMHDIEPKPGSGFAPLATTRGNPIHELIYGRIKGYGYPFFGDGVPSTATQGFVFQNAGGDPDIYELTWPYDNYAVGGGGTDYIIKATGSLAEVATALSSSIKANSSNYHITSVGDGDYGRKRINITATATGSAWNADFTETGDLFTISQNMQGGYDQYNALDNNWILLAHSGSGNFLFKVDTDTTGDDEVDRPTITRRNETETDHQFDVTYSSGFSVQGNLVTGSAPYTTTHLLPIVLIRGSTYRFKQDSNTNNTGELRFSTVEDGEHNSTPGTEYVGAGPNVTKGGTPGTAGSYTQISCSSDTPDRLFIYAQNGAVGDTSIPVYVLQEDAVKYVDADGTPNDLWTNLQTSISTTIPRLNVSYSDAQGGEKAAAGAVGSDDYQPVSDRALFKITGSTVSSSFDDTKMYADGPSWEFYNDSAAEWQPAATFGASEVKVDQRITDGFNLNEKLTLKWGSDPSVTNPASSHYGPQYLTFVTNFFSFDGTPQNSLEGVTETPIITIQDINTITTASGPDISQGSAWQYSSSVIWNQFSSSIKNTGQYYFTTSSAIGPKAGLYKIFNIQAKYYGYRYNRGHASEQQGFVHEPDTDYGAGTVDIWAQMTGGMNHTVAPTQDNDYLEMTFKSHSYLPNIGTKRLKIDTDGFRHDPLGMDNIWIDISHHSNQATWKQVSSSLNTYLTSSEYGLPDNRIFDVSIHPVIQGRSLFLEWGQIDGGQNHSLMTATNPNIHADTTDFATISFWMKLSSQEHLNGAPSDEKRMIVETYKHASGNACYQLYILDNKLTLRLLDSTSTNDRIWNYSSALPHSEWIQVSVSFSKEDITATPIFNVGIPNQGTGKLNRLSGIQVSGTGTGAIDNPDRLTLMDIQQTNQDVELGGNLCDFVVWDEIALTAHEAIELYNRGARHPITTHSRYSTVTAWWKLGDGPGQTVMPSTENPSLSLNSGGITTLQPSNGGANLTVHHSGLFVYVQAGPPTANAVLRLTSSVTGSNKNLTNIAEGGAFFNPDTSTWSTAITGSTDYLEGWYSSDRRNIKIREQATFDTVLTTKGVRQKSVITSRFAAPGGPEVQTEIFLDAYAKEFSVHNAIPYRNLQTRGRNPRSDYDGNRIGGSGEASTHRANSHANRRETLNTLHSRHAGNAGTDSKWVDSINDGDFSYVRGSSGEWEKTLGWPLGHEPSFHKIHRNTLVTPRLSGSDDTIKIVERSNNFYYQSHLPQSDYHYSWSTSSLGDNYSVRSGRQRVFGYWPKDGMLAINVVTGAVGSFYEGQVISATHVSAINFMSASEILGSE